MSRLASELTVRYGTPRQRAYVTNRAKAGMTVAERLMLHAVKVASGCWQWQLALKPGTGYAGLTIDGKGFLAHRLSYETFVGPIPDGLHLDHLCRNRGCINPDHLEPVTPKVNMRRGESPGAKARRRDLCEQGHPYSEHAVIWQGRRTCRLCRKTYSAIYRSMTRDEREARRSAGLPMVDLAAYFEQSEAAA